MREALGWTIIFGELHGLGMLAWLTHPLTIMHIPGMTLRVFDAFILVPQVPTTLI